MAAVACVRGGCVCSWINGVEKSREQFTVSERVSFCSSYYCRVVDSCVSSSSSSSSVSWPPFFPVITMCSTSSSREKSGDIQPLRKRNTRAANPSRQQQGVTTTGRISASDLHLVTALHEFIAAGDLPPQQVPSTRDLARSGRQDLANAVRRRGYKVVGQLLANPNFLKTSDSDSVQTEPSSGVHEHETTHQEHHDIWQQVQQHAHIYQTAGRNMNGYMSSRQINGLGLELGPSCFLPHPELVVGNGAGQTTLQRDCAALSETPLEPAISTPSLLPHEGRPKSYLNHRTGLLDEEDQAIDISLSWQLESCQGLPTQPNMAKHTQGAGKFNNGSTNGVHDVHADEHSSNDKGLQANSTSDFSGSQESIAWQKAVMLKSKLQSFLGNPVGKTMVQKPRDQDAYFDDMAKEEEPLKSSSHLQENQDIQAAPRTDLSTELDCTKALLHTKEMENLSVIRELEEVKALLALIRVKAAAEVVQAKQQAAEKDFQLQVAQQALQSLKLVHVDWWGEGKRVELAGSFNGWEHHVCLFPDLASESPKHDGSRGPMMWSVELWLYPGVHEIKFIVDGKWQIDPQREAVHHHIGSNNLLRVDP
ncbi:unnamed protein product [Sphagnum balticum]